MDVKKKLFKGEEVRKENVNQPIFNEEYRKKFEKHVSHTPKEANVSPKYSDKNDGKRGRKIFVFPKD